MAATPKFGSGMRFKALEANLAAHGARNPKALAASIGRKKLGKARMAKLATAGRARAAKTPAARTPAATKVKAPDTGGGQDSSGY